ARGNKIDVGLHGVARGRQDTIAADRFIGRETCRFNQAKPLLDASRPRAVTIVIDDAFAPSAPEIRIFGSREDRSVFDRDSALVVVTIESPGLKLGACELALVHKKMKWMLVVVTLFADGLKAGDEFRFREQSVTHNKIRIGIPSPHTQFPSLRLALRGVRDSLRRGWDSCY